MSILTEFPYPFEKAMARELIRVMAGLYRTEREALLFTAPFGVDPLTVAPGLTPINLWHDLLQDLAIKGMLPSVVKAAQSQFPGNPRAPFLAALLEDKQAAVSAEPIADNGSRFDDRVSRPEALLFF